MAPDSGLGSLYAKNMEHFGCGVAMFQPVSGGDMRPPCAGYIDSAGKWNLVVDIAWKGKNGKIHGNRSKGVNAAASSGFEPLEVTPNKMEHLGIEWRPRTSMGVRQWVVDLSGDTPSTGLPVGAGAHVKYKSNTKFGAVLIAHKPVTLTTYNDETLFQSWLSRNKALLSALHGPQLRRYGLWLVTTTYTAPRCSINAWLDSDKEATLSAKVKASMLGDLGDELDWADRLTDKDWTHYFSNDNGDGVVMFFDGIEVPAWEWWWEGVKVGLGNGGLTRKKSDASPPRPLTRGRRASLMPRDSLKPEDTPRRAQSGLRDEPTKDMHLRSEDLWGDRSLRRTSVQGDSPTGTPTSLKDRNRRSMYDELPRRSVSTSTPTKSGRYSTHDYEDGQLLRTPLQNFEANRLSSASTATSGSHPRRENRVSDCEVTPRHSLRRKTPSPSLRPPKTERTMETSDSLI